MYGLSKFSGKKVIGLATLVAFCSTPIVFNTKEANAIGAISRAGSRIVSSLSRTSNVVRTGSSLRRPTGVNNAATSATRLSTLGGSQINGHGSSINNRRNSTSSMSSVSVAGSSTANNLSQRLGVLEHNLEIENQRKNHILNKVVVASGLVSGAMLITGVVGGIIQQARMMDLNKEQAEKDQKLQSDLTNMREVFNKKEIPEAEKHIIDYYKENFGIDITK